MTISPARRRSLPDPTSAQRQTALRFTIDEYTAALAFAVRLKDCRSLIDPVVRSNTIEHGGDASGLKVESMIRHTFRRSTNEQPGIDQV